MVRLDFIYDLRIWSCVRSCVLRVRVHVWLLLSLAEGLLPSTPPPLDIDDDDDEAYTGDNAMAIERARTTRGGVVGGGGVGRRGEWGGGMWWSGYQAGSWEGALDLLLLPF